MAGERRKPVRNFNASRFLKLFALPVVLHMLWNSSIDLPFNGKYIILGIVAWIVILGLIQEGLKELRMEKAAAMEMENQVGSAGAQSEG